MLRQFIEAGEPSLALEEISGALAQDTVAITDQERTAVLALARQMGSMTWCPALAFCLRLIPPNLVQPDLSSGLRRPGPDFRSGAADLPAGQAGSSGSSGAGERIPPDSSAPAAAARPLSFASCPPQAGRQLTGSADTASPASMTVWPGTTFRSASRQGT